MKQYPRSLNRLINELGKLPGIGGKTAQRLAFHVLSLTDREAETLADAIVEAKRSLHYCSVCGNLTDKDVCGICSGDTSGRDGDGAHPRIQGHISCAARSDLSGGGHRPC